MSASADLDEALQQLVAAPTAVGQSESQSLSEVNAHATVAKALRAADYERVILAVSATLSRMKTGQQGTSETARNLYWARASAYRSSNMPKLALADARKALKISPDDPEAYFRTAMLLLEFQHHDQALQCLNTAKRKLESSADYERDTLSEKVDRQRRKLLAASPGCTISSLPLEILLLVLQEVRSIHATSLVCRAWRSLILRSPSMWRRLVLRQGIPEKKCIDLLTVYTERSQATIEFVEVPVSVTLRDLRDPSRIISALRQNAASLRHIKMPSTNQRMCYETLYRYCDNLRCLDIRMELKTTLGYHGLRGLVSEKNANKFPSTGDASFKLEVYNGDPGQECGFPPSSTANMRILRYCEPASDDTDERVSHIFNRIVSCADTLEELCLNDSANFGKHLYRHPVHRMDTESVSRPIVFKKLKILTGWLIPRNFNPCVFPALKHATVQFNFKCEGRDVPASRPYSSAAKFFEASPNIETLTMFMDDNGEDPNESGFEPVWSAIGRLEHLSSLTIYHGAEKCEQYEQLVAPRLRWDPSTQKHVPYVPCAQLKHFMAQGDAVDGKQLLRAFIMRDYLAKGQSFQSARQQTQSHVKSKPSLGASRFSPFQRSSSQAHGSALNHDVHTISDAQHQRFDVCQLETLSLPTWNMDKAEMIMFERLTVDAPVRKPNVGNNFADH